MLERNGRAVLLGLQWWSDLDLFMILLKTDLNSFKNELKICLIKVTNCICQDFCILAHNIGLSFCVVHTN